MLRIAVMNSWIHFCLALFFGTAASSCATRTFCDSKEPRLPHARTGVAADKHDEKSRVARYIVGQTGNDGFRVEAIEHIEWLPICGNPLLGSVYTLGLVPVWLPSPAHVTVTGKVGAARATRTYRVNLHTWTSLWLAVVPPSCDDRALARGLLGAMNSTASRVPVSGSIKAPFFPQHSRQMAVTRSRE
jgi:hypothetical protein